MKKIIWIALTTLLITGACGEDRTRNPFYSLKTTHGVDFGPEDIDEMLTSKDSMSTKQLDEILDGKESFESTIRLNDSTLTVHRWEKGDNDLLVYYTENSIKLMVINVNSTTTADVYVIRDFKYEPLVLELIENKGFIFNQMNDKPPESLLNPIE